MAYHLFVAGVPATGKTWLGCWLAERGYIHIDAEKNQGADFDRVGLHGAWDQLIAARQALPFVKAASALGKPVVVNWGFRLCYLYVVTALQSEGVAAWWLHAKREQARAAFLARGGFDVACFDRQMDDIERDWPALSLVFGKRVVHGLRQDGSQRTPEEIWADITAAG